MLPVSFRRDSRRGLLLLMFAWLLSATAVSFAVEAEDWPSEPLPPNAIRITVVFSNDVHGGIQRTEAEF